MADAANPYAPPTAEVDAPREAGEVVREGKLLRMDRNATLPSRCVSCNAPATRRIVRALYWSPVAWRVTAWAVPVLVLVLAFSGGMLAMVSMGAFWPVVILMIVANAIVRRKLELEIPLCTRHGRVRAATTWMIWSGLLGTIVLVAAVFTDANRMSASTVGTTGLGLVLLMLAGAVVRNFTAAERIGLQRLEPQRAWLKRTGERFRASFPVAS